MDEFRQFVLALEKKNKLSDFYDLFQDLYCEQHIENFKEEARELGFEPIEYIESNLESQSGVELVSQKALQEIANVILSGKLKERISL